jgi:hypothetical protein
MSEKEDASKPGIFRLVAGALFLALLGSLIAAPTYALLHFTFGFGVPISATLAIGTGASALLLMIRLEWGWLIFEAVEKALAIAFRFL